MGIGEVGELLRRLTVHVRGTNPRRQSAGSGVIWDSAGTIVTNAHVVEEGTHLVELLGWQFVSIGNPLKRRRA